MRKFFLLIKLGVYAGVCAELAGCSLPALRDPKQLDAMLGQSSVTLVRSFGVPSRSYQAQDSLFLAYVQTDTQYPHGLAAWGWGGGGYGYGWGVPSGWQWNGFPPAVYSSSCQTTFELLHDKVTAWTKRGDGC